MLTNIFLTLLLLLLAFFQTNLEAE